MPLGSAVENTKQPQSIAKVRVYPGADVEFTLFADDGTTYAYENGAGTVTKLRWDDGAQKLSGADASAVEVAGH